MLATAGRLDVGEYLAHLWSYSYIHFWERRHLSRLAEVVAALKEHGQSVLVSESDHGHSAELLDRLYVIERGAVKEK